LHPVRIPGFALRAIGLRVPFGSERRSFGMTPTRHRYSHTGKGIGSEYLQNDLFTPFMQEDPLASGSGLGLSLLSERLVYGSRLAPRGAALV
jgi:hypothetical protein